jgi:hypothetical protein
MVQSVAALLVWFGVVAIVPVRAGDLDSPGGPTDAASQMFTLEAIYNRLDTGAAGAKSGFAEPAAGPTAGTGRTLDAVMGKAPAVHANAAATTEVLSGKTFWGLSAWAWGLRTGSMSNIGAQTITPGTAAQTITQGYHNGSGAVAGDTDLVTGNIRSGVEIFGVAGKTEVVDTTSGDAATTEILVGKKAWVGGSEVTGTRPTSPVPKTGQTPTVPLNPAPTGSDGNLQKGVAWPSPRFTDNSNGTVTDNLTGLVWLKNANVWGVVNWATALSNCNTLANGTGGLTDGSSAGAWRLPNARELQSLIDYGQYNPALPSGHPFTGVQSSYYWSGTTGATNTAFAWSVYVGSGGVVANTKTGTYYYVWPVRSGQ